MSEDSQPGHYHSPDPPAYLASRYSDRYQPSMPTYHYYTSEYSSPGYTTTSYRAPGPASHCSPYTPGYQASYSQPGPTSPRWRRRSYDHDSDYLRYQRRSSARVSSSDYPSSGSSALTRSRSRSRVSEYCGEPGSYLASRPHSSSYLYGHTYASHSNYGGGLVTAQHAPLDSLSLSVHVKTKPKRNVSNCCVRLRADGAPAPGLPAGRQRGLRPDPALPPRQVAGGQYCAVGTVQYTEHSTHRSAGGTNLSQGVNQ